MLAEVHNLEVALFASFVSTNPAELGEHFEVLGDHVDGDQVFERPDVALD
ncbi:hypothetical protein ACPPVQ_10800 [Diaminobutyricibacter sp. McL0618]